MQEIIKQKIREIEEKEQICILHAIESGSRAWGFASPDSDYDVRFIYVRKQNFYMKLEKTRDVIEWQLDETLDINGWDLQKALRLLHTSNPTLFEWANSPIIYSTTPFFTDFKTLINDYFSCRSGLWHYLSTAEGNYREYLKGETVRLKKYFYVLRPLLACRWILDKKTPPPMLFSELVKFELPSEMKEYIDELLRVKIETPEIGESRRIDAVNDYIEREIIAIKEEIEKLPKEQLKDWKRLNELFMSALSIFEK